MPRLPRIYFEGALYYVIAEADHNKELFKDDADYHDYLGLIKKYKEQYKFKLYSFSLMPRNIHLLIEPVPETTISQIMHDLNSAYTKYFNGRYEGAGHLFSERFRSVLIERETYLAGLTRFIHLLPVEDGLVSKPEDYLWSSYVAYLSNTTGQVEVDTQEVLGNFALELEKSRLLYQEFVTLVPKNEIAMLTKKLQDASFLGSQDFAEKIKDRQSAKPQAALLEKMEDATIQQPQKRTRRTVALVIFVFFCVVTGYFLKTNLGFRKTIEKEVSLKEAKKELEFNHQLKVVREDVQKDLEEKYRADIVSSQALVKRLEGEQKKAAGL